MIKILVIDDEPDLEILIRQKFRRQISAKDYAFVFAPDGVAALEVLADDEGIDIVLSDINMPRMDGLTLLARLRESNEPPQVVMISAYGDMANIRSAMNRGAFDFIVKPIDFNDLQLTIDKTISQVRQLHATREKLRRVDILKDQFLANTSHELRTPLLGIIGLAESMSNRLQNPENQEDISMIISSGRRLSHLVDDILDFSRLRNADLTIQCKPIHLSSIADLVLKHFAVLTAGKNIELLNLIPEDIPAAYADENRLLQIFFNLVGNAVKFTESGQISLSAQEKDGLLEITVADTGIGIPEDKQEIIFQDFTQSDASATRSYAGTGLGLSISRKLVELHQGALWVESTPGVGSTFFFTLPVSSEDARPATPLPSIARIQSASPDLAEAEKPLRRQEVDRQLDIHILIVDDEPINQQVLKNHLASQNFRISQALDGEQALRILENEDGIDLVLLDVMMPRMSGYEVCEKIRQKHLASELPVIMVTAKNQVQDLVQGLALGANDYIAKPFSREEFLARIHTQLDLHRIFEVTGRFVPNEFIHALGRERITEVALGDQTEREVTVLFSDIRNYTSLSESMTPEQNFRFINAFHGRMGPVIQQHRGFVNQYLGDGIMAIFPQSAENALSAAVQIHQNLHQYNQTRQTKGRTKLRIGIGLHTGPLIMGIIGDAKRMDAATIADTVNSTSRIENLTKHYGAHILFSGATLKQLPDQAAFNFRYLGQAQVKGKEAPLQIYECFDGDEPAVHEGKARTAGVFAEALQHYLAQSFDQAISLFRQIRAENPGDGPAAFFLNLSTQHLAQGVATDWTGAALFQEK